MVVDVVVPLSKATTPDVPVKARVALEIEPEANSTVPPEPIVSLVFRWPPASTSS